MKVVFLTAGAAGMFCGSCMHDNATARTLRELGVDCILQPVYTPIRTDELSVAQDRVFFGGIHIYLLQRMPWIRFVPKLLRRFLDHPGLIRLVSSRAMSTDAAELGALAISMLQGADGRLAEEVERLTDWLASEMNPDVIVLSNLLIGGSIPIIRERLPNTKILVILQGDDIFLDHLPEAERARAIALCSGLVEHVDRFIVHSRFYGDKMSALLGISGNKISHLPLSIDTTAYLRQENKVTRNGTFRLGYLARIAPEKGLHRLVDAFLDLSKRSGNESITLHIAGWLGEMNRPYLDTLRERIDDANLSHRVEYHISPTIEAKAEFLRTLDLLCVPTEYEDPKGLFALEAMASGVAVLLPNHGAFGELISSTGGGVVVPPGNHQELVEAIEKLKLDLELRESLANAGYQSVHSKHSIESATRELMLLFSRSMEGNA